MKFLNWDMASLLRLLYGYSLHGCLGSKLTSKLWDIHWFSEGVVYRECPNAIAS